MSKNNKPVEVRIIAGKFKGRKIKVPAVDGLRPTHDRVRETLFNWLQPMIVGKHCLDAFSGTGALGFEALSRGAKTVTFVESNPVLLKGLKETASLFRVLESCFFVEGCWPNVTDLKEQFDLVFLDPPFSSQLIEKVIVNLFTQEKVAGSCVFYLEYPVNQAIDVSDRLELTHSKKTKSLHYELYVSEC